MERTAINSLEELRGFDAIIAATGAATILFPESCIL